MSEILDFWTNKHNYKPEELNSKITEFYRADFIENYTKWKEHLNDLNENAKLQLLEVGMPEKYWQPLEYDTFCQNCIEILQEWITVNGDINRKDILLVYQKLFNEFLGLHLKIWGDNLYTMDELMLSIKKTVTIPDAEY